MSYASQWALTYDDPFVSRCRACLTNQAAIFKDDARPDFVALAQAVMTSDPPAIFPTWQSLLGAAPGFADAADTPGEGVDSSAIADEEILAAVQGLWPTVAGLYFDAAGEPLP
jgi:hypothetical protein